MATAYEDDLTEAEKAELAGAIDAPAQAGDDKAAEDPPRADVDADPAPSVDPAPSGEKDDSTSGQPDEIAAFKEKHAGKSPEELLALAFQQSKRAAAEGFQARKSQQEIDQIRARAAEIRAQREAEAQRRLEETNALIADDPDEAVRRMAQREYDADVDRIRREDELRAAELEVEEAIAFASSYIPEFHSRAPQMFAFGRELGFDDATLHGIRDGRQLVVLELAEIAGRLMKADVIDRFGNLISPAAVSAEPKDPRLQAPVPPNGAASGGGAAVKGTDPVKEALNMSDDELAKISDEDFMKIFG